MRFNLLRKHERHHRPFLMEEDFHQLRQAEEARTQAAQHQEAMACCYDQHKAR